MEKVRIRKIIEDIIITQFLNSEVVKTVAPALGVIDQLPIADTLKKLKGDDKK